MVLPTGHALRAPTTADLDAVADVLIADELDDGEQVVLGAEFVRGEWSKTGFDLATDAWVAVDGARAVVGYAQVRREEPTLVESWGVVHPRHRRQGIGSSLLDRVEERASHLLAGVPSGRFRHAVNAGDRAAAAMLRARGLRPVRHFWHMRIDLVGPVEPGLALEGVEIGPVKAPDDLPAVHAVLDAAFADDWGYRPEPFPLWAEQNTDSPSHDPTLWLLATVGGEPVGALTAGVWGDRGWVNEVGVLASHRGRGIGSALLLRSFGAFARREVRRVFLNVDAENSTGATSVYERAGMRVVKRWDLWERASGSS